MKKQPKHPGKHFTEIIKKSGKTQGEAAVDMGIDPSKLSRYLAGKTALSVDLAKRFSVYFGVEFLSIISLQAEYELSGLSTESFNQINPLSKSNE